MAARPLNIFVQSRDLIARRLRIAILLFTGLFGIGTFGYWGLGQIHGDLVRWSLADCAYMTAISLTTVGYGEILELGRVPGARAFTMLILGLGLGIAVYFSAALTTFLVEGEFEHIRARRKMNKILEGLSDHVIVCGVGAAGTRAVEELMATRTKVVAVDDAEDRLGRLAGLWPDATIPVVQGDAMTDDVMRQAGITRALGIICALHDDRDNLFLTVSARQLNPKIRIVTKGEDVASVEKLRRAGADSVVTPATIGGLRMVSEMIRPHAVQFLENMMRDNATNMRIEDVSVPPTSPAVGRPIRDEAFRAAGNFLVLAVKSAVADVLHYAPSGDHVLEADTHLVVLAGPDTIARLRDVLDGKTV